MTNIYIRTRGDKIDYNVGFLLVKKQLRLPDTAKYRTDTEQPTCILETTEDDKVYLFLSRIPSKRKDRQETPIYYDLVVEKNQDSLSEDKNWEKDNRENKTLNKLICIYLEDVRNALKEKDKQYKIKLPNIGKSKLGKILDDVFYEDEIEKFLLLTKDKNWSDQNKKNLNNKIEEFKSKIYEEQIIEDTSTSEEYNDLRPWWGGVKNDESYNKWIQLVTNLLTSKDKYIKGKALLLNVGMKSHLNSLFVEQEYFGALLDREYSQSKPIEIKPSSKNIDSNRRRDYFRRISNGIKEKNLGEELKKIAEKEADRTNKMIIDGIKKIEKKNSSSED